MTYAVISGSYGFAVVTSDGQVLAEFDTRGAAEIALRHLTELVRSQREPISGSLARAFC